MASSSCDFLTLNIRAIISMNPGTFSSRGISRLFTISATIAINVGNNERLRDFILFGQTFDYTLVEIISSSLVVMR